MHTKSDVHDQQRHDHAIHDQHQWKRLKYKVETSHKRIFTSYKSYMYKPIRAITQFYRFSNTLTIFPANIRRTQQNEYQGFIDNPAHPKHFLKIGFREYLRKK